MPIRVMYFQQFSLLYLMPLLQPPVILAADTVDMRDVPNFQFHLNYFVPSILKWSENKIVAKHQKMYYKIVIKWQQQQMAQLHILNNKPAHNIGPHEIVHDFVYGNQLLSLMHLYTNPTV